MQELASELPISRPAVSRHLRVLKQAGLVSEEPVGTRRIYRLQEQGMRAVQAYLESVWGDAARRFTLMAENTGGAMIEPLRLSLSSPARWSTRSRPGRRGSAPGGRPTTRSPASDELSVVLEPRVGGRIYERTGAGAEHDWGEVTVWEPPSRLAYSWHLRRDRADATDVEIRFVARGPASDAGRDRTSRLGAAGRLEARTGETATSAAGTRCCRII